MVTFEIDGQQVQVEEGEPIIKGAEKLGIKIPTLCHCEWLEPYGACRVCTVEVVMGKRHRMVTACNYPAREGLRVLTQSERALSARRMVLEMQLARCSTVPIIQELAREHGIEKSRFGEGTETCIMCGLCVRICSELVGAHALCFGQRGTERYVSTPFQREGEASPCIACGACADVCPTGHIWMEDLSARKGEPQDFYLGPKSAIAIPTQQAVPKAPRIDPDACIHLQTRGCGICEQVCEPEAVDLSQEDEEFEIEVGQILTTTGFQLFDPRAMSQYGYGRLDNVLTSLEFEMMLNSTGPTGGQVLMKNGETPRAIGILHCVGSRDENHHAYCSRVCCMYAMKFAHLVKDRSDAEVYQFYIDMEAYGKGYHEFYTRILSEDVNVIRGKAAEVSEETWGDEADGVLHIRCEDTLIGKFRDIPVDMVVLCCAIEPQADIGTMAQILGLTRSPDGFLLERHPKLDPIGTNTDGIYIAGTCQGPKDIPDTVAQAQAAAARILALIAKGKVLIDPIKASITAENCSGCRMCNSLCPYQAISFDEEEEVSVVNDTLCKGCGTCVAACPSGAIRGAGFTDNQILAELEGILI
jgi:heterodisulfide reductase subunit A2